MRTRSFRQRSLNAFPHLQIGYSLVEVVVVAALAAVLTVFAVPAYKVTVQNNRVSATVHTLFTSIYSARNEALNRSTRVTLCKSSDESTCDNGTTKGWETGWILFLDNNNDGTRSGGEEIIQIQQKLDNGVSIDGGGDLNNYISYGPTGFSRVKNAQGPLSGQMVLCDDRGYSDDARVIVLSKTGHVRSVVATSPEASAVTSCTL